MGDPSGSRELHGVESRPGPPAGLGLLPPPLARGPPRGRSTRATRPQPGTFLAQWGSRFLELSYASFTAQPRKPLSGSPLASATCTLPHFRPLRWAGLHNSAPPPHPPLHVQPCLPQLPLADTYCSVLGWDVSLPLLSTPPPQFLPLKMELRVPSQPTFPGSPSHPPPPMAPTPGPGSVA